MVYIYNEIIFFIFYQFLLFFKIYNHYLTLWWSCRAPETRGDWNPSPYPVNHLYHPVNLPLKHTGFNRNYICLIPSTGPVWSSIRALLLFYLCNCLVAHISFYGILIFRLCQVIIVIIMPYMPYGILPSPLTLPFNALYIFLRIIFLGTLIFTLSVKIRD